MEWSKAKNILIVLLVVVDVFLLGMYIWRTETAKKEEHALRVEVCDVLRNMGISVSEDMIPKDSMGVSPAIISLHSIGRKDAERLLGNVTESTSEDSTTFSGEKGTLMITKDSFSIVYESGRQVLGTEKAKTLAREIATALSVEAEEKNFVCKKDDGGYIVTIRQIFSDAELFDCDVEMKISENGSVIVSGKYICEGEITTYSGDVLSASAVMLAFADEVKKQGLRDVNVESINMGYAPKVSDGERLSLAPTLGIRTNHGMFLVDMQTERISVE